MQSLSLSERLVFSVMVDAEIDIVIIIKALCDNDYIFHALGHTSIH